LGRCRLRFQNTPELDAGFRLLYELKPAEARAKFAVWQAAHPGDPLGSAAEAASYLFEECYRQGVLTSEFFLDDERFLGKIAMTVDRSCAMHSSPQTAGRKTWRAPIWRQSQRMQMPCLP